jgi:DNA-directed RNA polymerase delta subunit
MQSLPGYTDTKYLLNKLRQRNVDTGDLNEYSLKDILRVYPEFNFYRKFEIGLSENIQQRISLSDIIYNVLLKAEKPLRAKTVWQEVSKFRGFPQHIVEQYLYRNKSFIRMYDKNWTVRENYPDYDIKKNMIIDFAKKWLALRKEPVSAFFISESLKMAEKIKDITNDLVENVLINEEAFMQIANGYYFYKGSN